MISLLFCILVGIVHFCSSINEYEWTSPKTAKANPKWTKMTADASGQHLAAIDHTSPSNPIHISSNYGASWNISTAYKAHYSDIISDDSGKYLAATISGGGISLSSDYGKTWSKPKDAPQLSWTSIDSDATGDRYVAVVHLGAIFVSKDKGTKWVQTSAPSTDIGWTSVTSDAKGRHFVAVAGTGEVYFSKDGGSSWKKSDISSSKYSWTAVASDASGKYVSAVSTYTGTDVNEVEKNGVFYSSDYGETFMSVFSTGKTTSLAMDTQFGANLATIVKDSCGATYIMQSFDRGVTWGGSAAGKGAWTHLLSNADGTKLIAVQSSGAVSTGTVKAKKG